MRSITARATSFTSPAGKGGVGWCASPDTRRIVTRSLSEAHAKRSREATSESRSRGRDSAANASSNKTRKARENLLRRDLAAAYRLAYLFGWEELIYNHITVRLESDDGSGVEKFLINPYGLGYDEVTPASLVTLDVKGNVVDGGSTRGRVNPAGFLIHSAVHAARPDAQCVIHSHQEDVVAVGATKSGLLPCGQAYYALGKVAYHDYEGLALLEGERESLARDLGTEAKVVILKNHGCLTMGRTVAEAFTKHYFLVRACKQQVRTMSIARGEDLVLPPVSVQDMAVEQSLNFNKEGFGHLEFEYLKRQLKRMEANPARFRSKALAAESLSV